MKKIIATALAVGLGGVSMGAIAKPQKIDHVLLISIDGMHALDYVNCSKGVSGVNGGAPYCPNLA
ncbi:MAG: hypothetical protein PHY54_16795, partial [Methylococcales bacterium]|nr:hypothetical protein [Methylococcales bacterium]